MVAAAVGTGVLILLRKPPLHFDDPTHVGLVALTWALFFWVAAQGIERMFEPMPTMVALPEGLLLFPQHDPDSVIPWTDIRRFEVFRFGKSRLSAPFLTVVVDDPSVVSRHLPWHLKIAYRIDRWAAGDNRYFRPRSDFDIPVQQVAEELETWRRTCSEVAEAPSSE